jgi:CRISPR-associated protein Csb1
LKGTRLKDTNEGKSLIEAKPQNARAIYELSPATLLFGAWNSTGEGGGIGAKFPRCVVSEIIGIGVATEHHVDARTGELSDRPSGQRAASRIDPLGIRSGIKVYKLPNGDWSLDAPDKNAKALRPSEINHSNIAPSVTQLGVSVDYAYHNFVLSLAALRRLRFVGNSGVPSPADLTAQTALAALGLAAATAQDRNGYFLRSRCDLVPEVVRSFEIVRANGVAEPIELDFDIACRLLNDASEAAKSAGIAWKSKDLVLKPQKKLVDLVKASRELALQGEAEAADEE